MQWEGISGGPGDRPAARTRRDTFGFAGASLKCLLSNAGEASGRGAGSPGLSSGLTDEGQMSLAGELAADQPTPQDRVARS